MANFGWNSRLPYLPNRNNNTTQIACRLCNQVFTNRDALIAHIDSHLTCEDMTLKGFHHFQALQQQNASSRTDHTFGNLQPIIPNFPRVSPSHLQEITRNVSADTRSYWTPSNLPAVAPPSQPPVVPPPRRSLDILSAIGRGSASIQPPSLGFSPNNNGLMLATQQFQGRSQQVEEMSTIASDGTKPFLKILDKPIKKIEFIDLVNIDDGESDSQALDLTLKL
ncbi:putative transcription factor C2H2 family [Senna tora]|uniref:Putative transcription factor C2H2 family n=1 Tax=Senna tora TaxID=362788 RepID=A0A834X3A3_9FABA|nr:putative transcription factor C2H2 family [Senna tora]